MPGQFQGTHARSIPRDTLQVNWIIEQNLLGHFIYNGSHHNRPIQPSRPILGLPWIVNLLGESFQCETFRKALSFKETITKPEKSPYLLKKEFHI